MNHTPGATTRTGALALGLVAVGVLLAGCAGAPTPTPAAPPVPASGLPAVADPAAANGFTATPQGSATLPTLPGPVFYVDIEQLPAATSPAVSVSRDCMLYTPGSPQPVAATNPTPTNAVLVGPHGGPYPAAGTTAPVEGFCVRPTSDRGQPAAIPGAMSIFASGDITDVTSPGPYTASLQLVQIQPGGRGGAHHHPGPETMLTLDGTTIYRLGGPTPVNYNGAPSPVTLTVGQAQTHKPDQPVQDFNSGTGIAKTLVFIIAPSGQPVRVAEPHTP